MNTEEKAKAYDEALNKIKPLYEQAKRDGNPIWSTYEYLIPELHDSEDERIRKTLIHIVKGACDKYGVKYKGDDITEERLLAYLEKQKEHFRDDTKKVEQKPSEWSEEDEKRIKQLIYDTEHIRAEYEKRKNELGECFNDKLIKDCDEQITWLKSLRPQPHEEIYQADKYDLAIRFMNYLDENRSDGKMCLSNAESEDIDKAFKENDWAKIMRYADKYLPHWKPSEEQIGALNYAYCELFKREDVGHNILGPLQKLLDDLNKLM